MIKYSMLSLRNFKISLQIIEISKDRFKTHMSNSNQKGAKEWDNKLFPAYNATSFKKTFSAKLSSICSWIYKKFLLSCFTPVQDLVKIVARDCSYC